MEEKSLVQGHSRTRIVVNFELQFYHGLFHTFFLHFFKQKPTLDATLSDCTVSLQKHPKPPPTSDIVLFYIRFAIYLVLSDIIVLVLALVILSLPTTIQSPVISARLNG